MMEAKVAETVEVEDGTMFRGAQEDLVLTAMGDIVAILEDFDNDLRLEILSNLVTRFSPMNEDVMEAVMQQ